jgi:hypothetical protein
LICSSGERRLPIIISTNRDIYCEFLFKQEVYR